MTETHFTATSFAEPREPFGSYVNFSRESVAKGLRELAASVERGATIVDGISSCEEVTGKEFVKVGLNFTYYVGDYSSMLDSRLKVRSHVTGLGLMSLWWDEVGQWRFRR